MKRIIEYSKLSDQEMLLQKILDRLPDAMSAIKRVDVYGSPSDFQLNKLMFFGRNPCVVKLHPEDQTRATLIK